MGHSQPIRESVAGAGSTAERAAKDASSRPLLGGAEGRGPAHLALRATLGQGSLELSVDLRILILEGDLVTRRRRRPAAAARLGLLASPADRQEEARVGARVEMLVEPALARD